MWKFSVKSAAVFIEILIDECEPGFWFSINITCTNNTFHFPVGIIRDYTSSLLANSQKLKSKPRTSFIALVAKRFTSALWWMILKYYILCGVSGGKISNFAERQCNTKFWYQSSWSLFFLKDESLNVSWVVFVQDRVNFFQQDNLNFKFRKFCWILFKFGSIYKLLFKQQFGKYQKLLPRNIYQSNFGWLNDVNKATWFDSLLFPNNYYWSFPFKDASWT